MAQYIFHLSIPVADLGAAKSFYVKVLEARVGREHDEWVDVLVWGHQVTLQHRPSEVLPLDRHNKRHFGVVLPWEEWERQAKRIQDLGVGFLSAPAVTLQDTADEQGKFYLCDPSNNVIEVKTYRNAASTLRLA